MPFDNQQEIKRIARKARRFAVRNKNLKPARYTKFDQANKGHFLVEPDYFKKA